MGAWDHYSKEARLVIHLAQAEARASHDSQVRPLHLLFAALSEEIGVRKTICKVFSLDVDELEAELSLLQGQNPEGGDTRADPPGELVLASESKCALDRALLQARRLSHEMILPLHIFNGLLGGSPPALTLQGVKAADLPRKCVCLVFTGSQKGQAYLRDREMADGGPLEALAIRSLREAWSFDRLDNEVKMQTPNGFSDEEVELTLGAILCAGTPSVYLDEIARVGVAASRYAGRRQQPAILCFWIAEQLAARKDPLSLGFAASNYSQSRVHLGNRSPEHQRETRSREASLRCLLAAAGIDKKRNLKAAIDLLSKGGSQNAERSIRDHEQQVYALTALAQAGVDPETNLLAVVHLCHSIRESLGPDPAIRARFTKREAAAQALLGSLSEDPVPPLERTISLCAEILPLLEDGAEDLGFILWTLGNAHYRLAGLGVRTAQNLAHAQAAYWRAKRSYSQLAPEQADLDRCLRNTEEAVARCGPA